jgi:outer membrane immunogenic protein
MRKYLLSVALVAALAGPAFAADLPSTKAPPPAPAPVYIPPAFTWTGFYVGADLGGVWTNLSDSDYWNYGLVTNYYSHHGGNNSGVFGGGHIGANYQINQFVIGVEGSFAGTSLLNSRYDGYTDTTWHTNTNWIGSVDGRLGLTGWFDRTLIYAIGGAAWTNGDASLTAGPSWYASNVSAGYANNVNWNKTLAGYDVGAGVEYAWTPNWTVRVEYRYYNFGNNNNQAIYWAPSRNWTLNENVVKVGLTYLFGAPASAPVVAKY